MTHEKYSQELKKIRGLLVGLNKGLTVTEISRKMGINRNSIAKYLDVLLTSGIVEMKVVGSAKLYTISKRMPLTSIINVSSDYVLVLDDDSRVSFANENMLSFEKKTLDEISGMSSGNLEVIRHAVPDIRKFIEESLQGREYSTDFEIRNGNESPVFFRAKFVPGILENNKKGLIIILNNISDIQQAAGFVPSLFSEIPSPPSDASIYLKDPGINQEFQIAPEEMSGDNYQKYIEMAREGIWAIDDTFRTSFANAWMAGMLGYSVNEMIGKPVYDFVPSHRKDQVRRYLQNLYDRVDVTKSFESEFTRKDGSGIFTLVGLTPFIDETGKFFGALATISDITERKKTEDALRTSENYYRTIIETSPNGILIFDRSGILKMANRQTAKYLGFSDPKDLEGKNLFDFISPNDLEKCQNFFGNSIDKQDVATVACTLIKKDSTGFCADLTISLLNEVPGTVNYFIGIITDITEHRKAVSLIKRSEHKYRSLVEEIGSIIFTTDINGKITYISPVVQKVLGFSPDELVGKHFYALVDSSSRSSLGIKLREAQSGKSQPSDFQMNDVAGNPRWIRLIAQPLIHEGRLQGISGIIEDINEWKTAEDALVQCEIKYKIVIEDQTDLICRFTPDFRIAFINPAFWKFFNQEEKEVLGKNFLDFIPEEYHEMLKATIRQIDNNNFVKNVELDLLAPKGNLFSYHATIRGVSGGGLENTEYQIICRDITELKAYFERSQSLLKDLQLRQIKMNAQNDELKKLHRFAELSEKRYRDLYDKVPVGILTLDLAGKIISLNQTATQMIGQSKKQLVGRSFSDFVSPECNKTFSDFFTSIFRVHKKQTCEVVMNGSGALPPVIRIEGYMTRGISEGLPEGQLALTDISEFKWSDVMMKSQEPVRTANPGSMSDPGIPKKTL